MKDGQLRTPKPDTPYFWREILVIRGTADPKVLPQALIFGAIATAITAIDRNSRLPDLGIEVTPYEVAGAALGLLLVLRTNSGYERWWEGRKLWGGIVNQSRNLAVAAVAYGPADPAWRDRFVRWVAAFAHAARYSLRRDRAVPAIEELLGPEAASRVAAAEHMPTYIALVLADELRRARDEGGLDDFGFLQADRERATLMDHVGGCERILKTPLPLSYAIETRRFLVLFLATLPFALVLKIGWLTPVVTVAAAFPLLALDRIGAELQNPFSRRRLDHLPLDDICATIEGNLLALLETPRVGPSEPSPSSTRTLP